MANRAHLLAMAGLAWASLSGQGPAQDLSQLPGWARQAVEQARPQQPPAGAEAWVLLDRTEVAYGGDGEIRTHGLRVVRVLTEGGFPEASCRFSGQGTWTLKQLKGWNLKPDGEMVRLDSDKVLTIRGTLTPWEVSTGSEAHASLPRVVKGSILAFESLEVARSPLGPVDGWSLLEPNPVRRKEIVTAKQGGWFTSLGKVTVVLGPQCLDPWVKHVAFIPGESFTADDLPPLPRNELGAPYARNVLPHLDLRFLDPELKGPPSFASWDSLASWEAAQFEGRIRPVGVLGAPEADPARFLARLWAWLGRNIRYKQVYLTAERGWVPESAPEVVRRAYGDCKDMACLFLALAKTGGLTGVPVLATIQDAFVEPGATPFPCFNHAIAALRLEHSLGLPAEVDTREGRFLLVDPTDALSPLGYLSEAHRGRQVMLCLPGGALWVAVPEGAIRRPGLRMDVTGALDAAGALRARVVLTEEGRGRGLRWTAAREAPRDLRDHLLASVFHLPPAATLVVAGHGDPWDLATPFQVTVDLVHPDALLWNGPEATLAPIGALSPPPLLQKAGAPRQYPVQVRGEDHFQLRMALRAPCGLQPVLGTFSQHTVRRALDWSARSTPEGQGCALSLALEDTTRDVVFGLQEREAGILAMKKDRNAYRTLLDDGFTFRATGTR